MRTLEDNGDERPSIEKWASLGDGSREAALNQHKCEAIASVNRTTTQRQGESDMRYTPEDAGVMGFIRRAATCGIACVEVHVENDYKPAPLCVIINADIPSLGLFERGDAVVILPFADWRKQVIGYGYGIHITTMGDAYLMGLQRNLWVNVVGNW